MNHRKFTIIVSIAINILLGMNLAAASSAKGKPDVTTEPPATIGGQPVQIYDLRSGHGVEVRAMNYGGVILELRTPDKNGKPADVVLGLDKLEDYSTNLPHFGGIIGRYANRIANGEFHLDGTKYSLPKNNGPNTLHGGLRGFDKALWKSNSFKNKTGVGVTFKYTSKNGEEGFPGNLTVTVTYTLTEKNELMFDYAATTDKATPINLTQHTYFNLSGDGNGDVLKQELKLNADKFTPVDKTMIPTGEIRSVKGTPLDFSTPTAIGERINDKYEQMVLANGYDHNFVVNGGGSALTFAAQVYDPASGRVLEVYTTEPGIQVYSGNFLDGTVVGKHGHAYTRREGFALETQHYPDSPNHPEFPSTILRPGQEFKSRTVYKFSTR